MFCLQGALEITPCDLFFVAGEEYLRLRSTLCASLCFSILLDLLVWGHYIQN